MKNIIFIAKFLLSFPGGGERSIFEELKRLKKKGYRISCITFDPLYKIGRFVKEGIPVRNYGLKRRFPLSQFIENPLNQRFIKEKLKENLNDLRKAEYVITQTLIVPVVSNFLRKNKIKYHYYLRDELQLNEFHNYEKGFRRILKAIKSFLELPFTISYKRCNRIALRNAKKIVANSRFMQRILKEKYGLKSEVVLPYVDRKRFSKIKLNKKEQKYISFIGGGNAMKGFDIVLKIAKRMPEEKFLIVGVEKTGRKKVKGNITYLPWQKDIVNSVYRKSKLMLVPSRWKEAYGRIPVETSILGIPVITSNKGGLPEANPNKKNIIKDFEDVDEWVERIRKELK